MTPVFIAIEGIDSTGKTTHSALLSDHLRSRQFNVVTCRDPGCSPIGEDIRRLLLDKSTKACQACEALLFTAARAELVASVIKPALEQGSIVVSDRFDLSSLAHQGYARGVPLDVLRTVNRFVSDGIAPDLTIVLDLAPEEAIKRKGEGYVPDRIEQRGLEYMQKAREGFLTEANLLKKAIVLNADRPVEVVQNTIRYYVNRMLK